MGYFMHPSFLSISSFESNVNADSKLGVEFQIYKLR